MYFLIVLALGTFSGYLIFRWVQKICPFNFRYFTYVILFGGTCSLTIGFFVAITKVKLSTSGKYVNPPPPTGEQLIILLLLFIAFIVLVLAVFVLETSIYYLLGLLYKRFAILAKANELKGKNGFLGIYSTTWKEKSKDFLQIRKDAPKEDG